MFSRWVWHTLLRRACKLQSAGVHRSYSIDPYSVTFSSTLSDSVESGSLFQTFRRSPSHGSHESSMYLAELRTSVRQNHNPSENENIQQQIHTAKDIKELTHVTMQPGFMYLHACSVLKYLGDWVREEKVSQEDVRSDHHFTQLVDLVVKKAEILPPFYLLLALRGIRAVGVNADNYECQSLQTSLRWKMRQMNMNLLVPLFLWQMDNLLTSLDETLLEEVRSTILRRWVEITDPTHALLLFSRTQKAGFPQEFINKLEDTLVDLTGMMSVDDLVMSLVSMSKLRKRSLPLLRSVSYHLTRKSERLTPSQAVRVLRACTTVKFIDEGLLAKVAENLLDQLSTITENNSSTIRAILISVRFLSWKRKDLLYELEAWLLKHKDHLCDKDVQAFLMAVSAVNHTPNSSTELLGLVDSLLSPAAQLMPLRIDVVWSLVVLGLARRSDIDTLISNPPTKLSEPQKLKLKQVIQWQQLVKGDQDEKLSALLSSSNLLMLDGKSGDLGDSVREALAQFIPRPKYLSEKVSLDNGLYLDAEFVIDSKGDPIPKDQWSLQTNNENKRIGVRTIDYWSVCVGCNEMELTGQAMLTTRLLQHVGYRVLHVPYTEFSVRDRTLAKVQYLQKKLQNLLSGSSPPSL